MSKEKTETPAPRAKARTAETRRAAGAAFADGVLSVTLADGEVVPLPTASEVVVNGVKIPAENVPAWFAGHAAQAAKVVAGNAANPTAPAATVPPAYFTLAETDEGVVARFDQR